LCTTRANSRRGPRLALAIALATLAAAAPAGAARPPLVTADTNTAVRGAPLARSFLGFSQEYNLAATWLGTPKTGLNPLLVNVYRHFSGYGSGPPVLRLGGGSSDNSWWNPSLKPRPRGIYFGIDYTLTGPLAQFLEQTRSRVILGLNLAARKPAIAVDWARAAIATLPFNSIQALEVGNEPDIYTTRPLEPDKKNPGMTRKRGYGPAAYLRELDPFLRALGRIRGHPPIAAPALCCMDKWVRAMPSIIDKTARRLGLVTIHRYPLHSCGLKRGQRGYPTARALLSPAALSAVREFKWEAGLARRHHLGLRVTESNSVACGGAEGVSDSFASALWAAQWAFAVNSVGAVGLDFHGSSPAYTPFSFGLRDGVFRGYFQPELYGLLLFGEATSHRGIHLPTAVYGERRRRPGLNIWTWAFLDRVDRVVRVAVLNLDPRARGAAVIKVKNGRGSGTLKRLLAPALGALSGITWGGQSYSSVTTSGELAGPLRLGHVRRLRGGRYRFDMPPASAALLTVPVPR
jgi:hypothetical protein